MNRLLHQLKQGQLRIGRGRPEVPGGVPVGSPVTDRGRDARLRTELDDAPSSLDKRFAPAALPTGPQPSRTRKATLSKARRAAVSQNTLSFWGLAPFSSADKSGDPVTLVPASMLEGSSLLRPPETAGVARRDGPSKLLGGANPFGGLQEGAGSQALLEPASPLSPEDDRTDRPSWP